MTTTQIGEAGVQCSGARANELSLVSESRPVADGRGYLEWVILLVLVIVMLAQLWSSVARLSITSDEVDHLHAGYRYLQCNDFGWNPEHPPLVKIVAALPLMAMSIKDPIAHPCGMANSKEIDFAAGHDFVFANPEKMLTAARWAVSLFSVLLLLTAWFAARKMFGLPVAIISAVLIAFDPNFLAHGALVTTDVAAALGILLTVFALYCYCNSPTSSRLLGLGVATGLALCVKYSAIVLVLIVPALLLLDAAFPKHDERRRRLLRYAGALLAVAAIALTVIWACYGFRYAARPSGEIWSPPHLPAVHGAVATRIIPQLERWRVLPEAYLAGLQDVLVESEYGRSVFLLGKFYREGKWFYFPVAAAIKFTLPLLLMLVMSALSLGFWRSKRRDLLFLLTPSFLFLAMNMSSKLNMGIRHLLPALPFLTIFAAAGAWGLVRDRKWAAYGLAAVLAFQIFTSLHAFPNYLSYSNELWGGPGETYRYLANSDVDWGQAQKMARTYLENTHPANCFTLRTYTSRNTDYGIPCGGTSEIQWDPLQTPFTGTMIVSSSMVDGVGDRVISAATLRTFKNLKPTAKIGGSALLVYQGTLDVSPLVAVQLAWRARKAGEQDPQAALELAQQAAQLDPSNGDAHVVMCVSYRTLGQLEKAEQECNRGLALVREDFQYGPDDIEHLENFITRSGLQIDNSPTKQ